MLLSDLFDTNYMYLRAVTTYKLIKVSDLIKLHLMLDQLHFKFVSFMYVICWICQIRHGRENKQKVMTKDGKSEAKKKDGKKKMKLDGKTVAL